MIKKLLLSMIAIVVVFAFSKPNFNDLNYLFEKYRIRTTIETLEKLKMLYPRYSPAWVRIQKLENYFLNKLPVSAYSTFVRIRLHNIINQKINEINAEKRLRSYQNGILNANTDLNRLLIEKRLMEQKKQQNNSNSAVPQIKGGSSFTPNQQELLYKQLMQKIKGQ